MFILSPCRTPKKLLPVPSAKLIVVKPDGSTFVNNGEDICGTAGL
jgi:hypothetical protein